MGKSGCVVEGRWGQPCSGDGTEASSELLIFGVLIPALRWPALAVSLLGLTLTIETNAQAHICEGVSRLGWKTLSECGWHHHKG